MWGRAVLREKTTDRELSYKHIIDIDVNGYPSMAFEKRFHNERKGKIFGAAHAKFFDDDWWYSFYVRPAVVDESYDYKIVDINSNEDVYDVVLRRFLEIAKTNDIILRAQSFIDAGESLEELLVKMDLENV